MLPGPLKPVTVMQPQFDATKLELPTAINEKGLGMFTYEDLPTYFAVPITNPSQRSHGKQPCTSRTSK